MYILLELEVIFVVDTGYTGIHYSKYWMPIHYDTIKDTEKMMLNLPASTEQDDKDDKV